MGRRGLRGISAVVALVLVPSIAPELFGQGCPHHLGHGAGGHGAAGIERVHGAGGHSDAADHPAADGDSGPGHHSHTATHPTTHPAQPTHPPTAPAHVHVHVPPPCTCVGSCPTSSGPAAPTAPPPVTLAPTATTPARNTTPAPQPTPRRAPYTLPFANAPPLT